MVTRRNSLSFSAIVLVLAGLGTFCADAQALTRPSVITFALLSDMTDTLMQFDGTQTYAGMKAAEKEINDNNLIGGGVQLNIEFINAPSMLAPANDIKDAIRNATQGRFGLIMPDWSTGRYVASVIQNEYNASIPVVGPRLMTTAELINQDRFSLSLRQPPAVEYLAILQYAMGSSESRCTAFTIVTRSLIDISQISPTLTILGLPVPVIINLPYPGSLANMSFSVSAVLDTWAASNAGYGHYVPPCAMLFTLPDDAVAILDAMYTDTRFNMSQMTFFTSAQTSEGVWNSTTHGTAPFSRVRFITNFIDPHSETIPFAANYRAALKAYLTSLNTSALPLELTYKPMLSTPTYPAIEGYLAVRWIAEILSRMPSINQSLFLDAVYSRHVFFVDDATLGPMTDRCVVPNKFGLPCFCNIGCSSLVVGAINLTTGIATSKALIPQDVDYGSQDLQMNQCYLSTSAMKVPLLIGQWTAWNATGSAATTSAAFAYLVREQVVQNNDNNVLPNALVSSVTMNDIMPHLPGETNDMYFSRVYATRRPTLMIGQEFLNVSSPVLNIVASPATALEDAPLATANNFTKFTWNLQTVFADIAHVMANYISDTYIAAAPRIVVVSDEDAVEALAVKSLHTFQIDPEVSTERGLATFATAQSMVQGAASTASGGQKTIFVIASRTSQVVANILNAVAAIPDAANPSSAFAQNFVVVAIAGPSIMYGVTLQVSASALANIVMVFPTPYMAFWEPTNSHRLRAAALLNISSNTILNINSIYTGLVVVDFLTAIVQAANAVFPTAELLANAMYKLHSITVEGVTLGPVDGDTCSAAVIKSQSPDRSCQCFKLLQTFSVFDFRDWLQTSDAHHIDYSWSMGTCGVVYQPLIVASKLNAALVGGCAAAGGVALLTGIFYFACCFGRRNNRSAPKDPNEPFAMVFTDIQSSTSLWARAPEAMGEALDQHHAILRSLVSKHDGYEVKTIGDSFMVAFKSATDATEFGLAIQTVLFATKWHVDIDDVYIALACEAHEDMVMNEDPKKAEERHKAEAGKLHQWEDANNYPLNWNGIRVRVGMHWGVGSIKLDPVSQGYDYYGTLVNTAARVEGVGNGGQVLATNDFFTQLEAEQFNMTDVDIKPLGPQPLRGLDAPVALYQLSPSSLRSREFADLRLDVEIALDTTESSNQTASSAPVDDTPLSMMARLLKRHKNSGPMYDYLTRVAQFMDTLLRTSPMSYRKDALKHYMKKWHVPLRKPKDSKEPIETSISFDLAALVVRVGLASEEAHQSAVSQGSHGKESTVGQPKRRRSNTSAHFTAVKSFGGAEEIDDGSDRPL